MMPNEETILDILAQEGKKWDKEKPQLDLVPLTVLEYLAPIYEYGVGKYGLNNWKKFSPKDKRRFFAALLRHLKSYQEGEEIDLESSLPHLRHALWNIVTFIWYDELDKKIK